MGYSPDDTDYVDTWRALEQLVRDGLVRSLGVSNFNSEQLARLVAVATIKPVTNQVECSPNLPQKKLREFCAQHDIVLTAYAPLTRPHRTAEGQQTALTDPLVIEIGQRHSKSPAQICLKYLVSATHFNYKLICKYYIKLFSLKQIQIGTVPIPKSSNKQRIAENLDLFDFELTSNELEAMQQLDINLRMCPFSPDENHKYFPFKAEF